MSSQEENTARVMSMRSIEGSENADDREGLLGTLSSHKKAPLSNTSNYISAFTTSLVTSAPQKILKQRISRKS